MISHVQLWMQVVLWLILAKCHATPCKARLTFYMYLCVAGAPSGAALGADARLPFTAL